MKRIALVLLGVVMLASWVWADEAEDLLRKLIERIEKLEQRQNKAKDDKSAGGLEALLERAAAGDAEATASLRGMRERIDRALADRVRLVANNRQTLLARRNDLSRSVETMEIQLARFAALDEAAAAELVAVERERKQIERKLADIARREAVFRAGLDSRAKTRRALETELDEQRRQRHFVDRQIEKLDEEKR
ncbi:MAG: hypothetical protein OER88_01400 [Planctomycetota bacterium]|nr:hypothetical protein [Planctomycetota bacterium]